MQALNAYIERQNRWNAMFKGEQFEVKTAQGRQRLASQIDSALSPENLTCDGELPRAEVNRRYRELTTVARQLLQLDPSVKIHEFCE